MIVFIHEIRLGFYEPKTSGCGSTLQGCTAWDYDEVCRSFFGSNEGLRAVRRESVTGLENVLNL